MSAFIVVCMTMDICHVGEVFELCIREVYIS